MWAEIKAEQRAPDAIGGLRELENRETAARREQPMHLPQAALVAG